MNRRSFLWPSAADSQIEDAAGDYIRLQAEFVYLAVILDGYSGKVVGWRLDRALTSRLAADALKSAIDLRSPLPGVVHHSDRGVQYTHFSKDVLSLRQICLHFGMRYSKVISWIEQGLLQAKRDQTRTGKPVYSIEFAALQKFCKEHRNLLITRRWPPHRIKFLEEYVFAPKHAELLRTRESKRENEAFDRGEYLDPDENFQRRA